MRITSHRARRSAKITVTRYANDLMNDHLDQMGESLDPLRFRLHTIEIISIRMGWSDLYSKIQEFKDTLKDTLDAETHAHQPKPGGDS